MAKKRRTFELFSLSFLDCICCGFGAMLLLFVLTIGMSARSRTSVVAKIQKMVSQLDADIVREKRQTVDIENLLKIRNEKLQTEIVTRDDTKKGLTELQDELSLLLQQRANLKDELDRLLGEKKDIPKQDETAPIPIPNIQRRQYLTGFNFAGNYMVFMVECSGGMLGNTVDDALSKLTLTDEEKRQATKWRRVVKSIQWIIANLHPPQMYQVMVYNNEVNQLIPERQGEWFDPLDRATTSEVLKHLDLITPKGGANMERAFGSLIEMYPSVDCIVLLTDGLPTLADSVPVGSTTDDRDRERLFRAAMRAVPRQTPVNTILFPMSGDPAAPFLFWQLADVSKGSLISPAPSWPDI